jgi:hypothetical protein
VKKLSNKMSQETYISQENSHVEDYLDYFLQLPEAPQFAILLKGQWGCGKSWFIDKYQEKIQKRSGKKSLYISLYGINSFSQIEDALFEAVHPLLSSKQAKIAGKLMKGILSKWVFKFDTEIGEDRNFNAQVPFRELFGVPLRDSMQDDSAYNLLIFDDLERCSIELESLLGYINNFVQSEQLKVIIIANEEEISNKWQRDQCKREYKCIKEKTIGKTLIYFGGNNSLIKASAIKNI